jgi:hypothetical protein
MRNLVLAAALALASIVPAVAEDAVAPAPAPDAPGVCWLGGLAFSVGSNMRAGDGVSSCLADGRWKVTTGPASGCLKDGNFYTLGSSAGIGDAKNTKQTCRKDGSWT